MVTTLGSAWAVAHRISVEVEEVLTAEVGLKDSEAVWVRVERGFVQDSQRRKRAPISICLSPAACCPDSLLTPELWEYDKFLQRARSRALCAVSEGHRC